MEHIDALIHILSYVSSKGVKAYKDSSKALRKATINTLKDKCYWKKRAENFHNFEIEGYTINWRSLCKNVETLGIHFALKIYCKIKRCNDEIDLLLTQDPEVLDLNCEGDMYSDAEYTKVPEDMLDKPLLMTCTSGNIHAVKQLLDHGCEADHYNVVYAAEHGHTKIVKLLLEDKNLDTDEHNEYGAADDAARNGHYECLKILKTDGRYRPHIRALIHGISSGNPKVVKILVSKWRVNNRNKRLNINKMFSDNTRNGYLRDTFPLKYACELGNINVVKELLYSHNCQPNYNNSDALKAAISKGHLDIVTTLFWILGDYQVNVSCDNNAPLRLACAHGHFKIVKFLLLDTYNRVNPAAESNDPLIRAVTRGYYDIVEFLLKDPRVDPGDRDNLAIKIASKFGYTDIIKLLAKDLRANCDGII